MKFEVRDPVYDDPEQWSEYQRETPQAAAEAYALHYDNSDGYYLYDGGELLVRDEIGHVTRWRMSGEVTTTYYATEVEQ